MQIYFFYQCTLDTLTTIIEYSVNKYFLAIFFLHVKGFFCYWHLLTSFDDFLTNQNHNKILEHDWPSAA